MSLKTFSQAQLSVPNFPSASSRNWIPFSALELSTFIFLFMFWHNSPDYFFFPPSLLNFSWSFFIIFLILPFYHQPSAASKGFRGCWRKKVLQKMWREAEGREKRVSFIMPLRQKVVLLPFPGGLEHFCCFKQLWTAKFKEKKPKKPKYVVGNFLTLTIIPGN